MDGALDFTKSFARHRQEIRSYLGKSRAKFFLASLIMSRVHLHVLRAHVIFLCTYYEHVLAKKYFCLPKCSKCVVLILLLILVDVLVSTACETILLLNIVRNPSTRVLFSLYNRSVSLSSCANARDFVRSSRCPAFRVSYWMSAPK